MGRGWEQGQLNLRKWLRKRSLPAVAWLALGVLAADAQKTPQPPPVPPVPPAAKSDEAHTPLTKEQAKELFRSVDEILSFVSEDTKLPVKHTVKRKLITRDEVNRFLREKFEEDDWVAATFRKTP